MQNTRKFYRIICMVYAVFPLFFVTSCSSAINPLSGRHPQESESFSQRHAPKDNAFLEAGGLSQKNALILRNDKSNIILDNTPSAIGQGGLYYKKPKPTYRDPLEGTYEEDIPLEPPLSEKPRSNRKGESSFLSGLFKKSKPAPKTANTSSNNVAADNIISTASEYKAAPVVEAPSPLSTVPQIPDKFQEMDSLTE